VRGGAAETPLPERRVMEPLNELLPPVTVNKPVRVAFRVPGVPPDPTMVKVSLMVTEPLSTPD